MQEYDYIIIGQGMAGSVLGISLDQAGKKVLIIDNAWKGSSSMVAAGIVNPVTGRRLVKSWKTDQLLGFALQFYKSLEDLFKVKFVNQVDILRVFENVGEQNDFLSKTADPNYEQYLSEASDEIVTEGINADLSFGEIKQSFFINTRIFLQSIEKYFISKQAKIVGEFDVREIEFEKDSIQIEMNQKIFQAKKIIFCEGHKMQNNPWFNYLPISPNKGEFLIIKSDELARERLIKKGVMIVPIREKEFWVGSTYDHFDLTMQNTEKGKEKVLAKLNKAISAEYEIVEWNYGIRPAVKDRRPLIGLHPEHPQLCLFNGLGSKGVSLAPYFADQLMKNLEAHLELDPQVNINRF